MSDCLAPSSGVPLRKGSKYSIGKLSESHVQKNKYIMYEDGNIIRLRSAEYYIVNLFE